jgi:hypothetical protein
MTLFRSLITWLPESRLPNPIYVHDQQISVIEEHGALVPSWEASSLSSTKKFDVETGEDAKGK